MSKCNSCFKKFKNYNLNFLKLPDEIIHNIHEYLDEKYYCMNNTITTTTKNCYCRKCFYIGIYQYNKNEQYYQFYRRQFTKMKNIFDETVLEYEDIQEIKRNIDLNWRFEKKIDIINFRLPSKKKDIDFFHKRFIGNLEKKSRFKQEEILFIFKWIKRYKIPQYLYIDEN